MLDHSYLAMGLDALSRAHLTNFFGDGHRGAAIISSCFLRSEEPVEAGAEAAIKGMIDQFYAPTPLCEPMPDEPADADLLGRLVETARGSIGEALGVGHNVIFASLALKAFAAAPELVTPSRIEGIRRLIDAFEEPLPITPDQVDPSPVLGSAEAVGNYVLSEFAACARAFDGRGQGWTGHMLTAGRAVVDLYLSGHADLARVAEQALRQYMARARLGPLDADQPRPERAPSATHPLQAAHWSARRDTDPGLGHCFKYPYGHYGLVRLVSDGDLRRRAAEESYRVL